MKQNLALCLLLLCSCTPKELQDNKDLNRKEQNLKGVYRLISLQSQEDTLFNPMEGVGILKIFTDSQWISPAWLSRNNKVVNIAGGTYTFSNGVLTETLKYHNKDTINIGLSTSFRVKLKNDTLYQSGIFKPGTDEEYKVEEYWLKIE